MLGKKAETFGKLQLIVSAETEAGTELLLKELDDFSRSRRAKNKKYKLLNKDTGQVYRHYQRKPNVSDWPQRWIPGKKDETYGKLQLQLIVSAETEAAPSNGKKRKRAQSPRHRVGGKRRRPDSILNAHRKLLSGRF